MLKYVVFVVTLTGAICFYLHGRGKLSIRQPASLSVRTSERAELCESQKRYLLSAVENKISLKTVIEKAANSNKKIVLFGESHQERSSLFFRWALEQLKQADPRFNCLLVELPKDRYQRFLDGCTGAARCDLAKVPSFSGIEDALNLGFQVKAIDAIPKSNPSDWLDEVSRRDQVMAHEASQLFLRGECERAVMIVGSSHMNRTNRASALSDHLRETGFYSVELVSPGFQRHGELDTRWIWLDVDGEAICSEVAPPLGENFAFLNSREGDRVPSFYGDYPTTKLESEFQFVGSWSNFDAAILLGCEDPTTENCPVYQAENYKIARPFFLKSQSKADLEK